MTKRFLVHLFNFIRQNKNVKLQKKKFNRTRFLCFSSIHYLGLVHWEGSYFLICRFYCIGDEVAGMRSKVHFQMTRPRRTLNIDRNKTRGQCTFFYFAVCTVHAWAVCSFWERMVQIFKGDANGLRDTAESQFQLFCNSITIIWINWCKQGQFSSKLIDRRRQRTEQRCFRRWVSSFLCIHALAHSFKVSLMDIRMKADQKSKQSRDISPKHLSTLSSAA